MNARELEQYCLDKTGAYTDFPFGSQPLCVKVGGRVFLQSYTDREPEMATFKCDRETGEMFRLMYPASVRRGYHCPPVQQPYFSTVTLDGSIPDEELRRMADHSYDAVVKKLPKAVRESLWQK